MMRSQRTFNKMPYGSRLQFNPSWLHSAKQASHWFASKVDYSYYTNIEARPLKKVQYDTFIGKLAEFVASAFISYNWNVPFITPDLSLHNIRTYDPDLPYPNNPIHVKSCNPASVAICGDMSWCFNINDPLLTKNSQERVAFVYVDAVKNHYTVLTIQAMADLIDILRGPVIPTIKNKTYIYWDELCQYLI